MQNAFRLLALTLGVLTAAPAFAARVNRAISGLPGQARFGYDNTARSFVVQLEKTDAVWATRFGYDGRDLGYYMTEEFNLGASKGIAVIEKDGTAFAGTAGALNHVYLDHGSSLICAALGAGQTLAPAMTATGLDISGDEVDTEGYECFSHMLGGSGAPLVIGTTPAFYFQVGFNVADVSGTDDIQCGLRKIEPVNAAINSYTDYVTMGWNTSANPAAVKIETEINSSAVVTDTTDTVADGVTLTMKYIVSAAGVVTYTNDAAAVGTMAAPTATAAVTLDDGDLVVPFCRMLQDAGLTGEVNLTEWTVALQ